MNVISNNNNFKNLLILILISFIIYKLKDVPYQDVFSAFIIMVPFFLLIYILTED